MSDFSSDYILEQYQKLNEINWSEDKDVCWVCGYRQEELSHCDHKECPYKKDSEKIPDEES